MANFNLSIRKGDVDVNDIQILIADFFAALAAPNCVQLMGEALDRYAVSAKATSDLAGRWDIFEVNDANAVLSTGGRKMGDEISVPFTINRSARDLIFGLPRFAAGHNGEVIAHLCAIDGQVKLYPPFDPRLLKLEKQGKKITGMDICRYGNEGAITVKGYLKEQIDFTFESLSELVETEVSAAGSYSAWLSIRQATRSVFKKYPDYTAADIVRVAIGKEPRNLEVDSNDV